MSLVPERGAFGGIRFFAMLRRANEGRFGAGTTRADSQRPFLGERKVKPSTVLTAALGLVSLLYACGNVTQPNNRCPGPKGEFPPLACALVSGVARDQVGAALAEMGLRVDSSILGRGYHYASNAFVTDQSGRFSMLVYRMDELTPRTAPDTASVAVKLHVSKTPAPRETPLSTMLVQMTFAPL